MRKLSRRTVLIGGAGALALALGPRDATTDRAAADTARRALYTEGTTLAEVAAQAAGTGYRRLTAGPGYPLVVREELQPGASARASQTALASLVQLTDLHLADAQSPARFELFAASNGSAFRPQEALGTHGAARLIARVNSLARGPFGGRAFDCVVSTGDDTDNAETVELDWRFAVLNGGTITADTGSRERWEGVQTSDDELYYTPERRPAGRWAQFPELPGFFGRAVAPHTGDGLAVPWYAVFGNHDDSVSGSLPGLHTGWQDVYTGGVKFTGFVSDAANRALAQLWSSGATSEQAVAAVPVLAHPPALKPDWQVTPDERRRPFTRAEYLAAHLDPARTGPGPAGHGFTAEAVAADRGYYDFPIAPGVVGISLDSTNPAGLSHGSLDDAQFQWLGRTLAAHADAYVLVFSHHPSWSMDSPLPDPVRPDAPRHSGAEVLELLHRHPQVAAWINGHTHANHITPRRGSDARHSLWEINTASHTDFPQQARIVELVKNGDGTLSLFTTLIESDAPYQAPYDDGSQTSLASLYRELSFNDPHRNDGHAGRAEDRNAELLLADPFA
ncbi:TIGR03767 family metallophosphoesterase [Gryllotalpicola ginsengisoli]|uniref:TIGR03767 family metallophosphoesterase n=1 Tax=Gryllotalpicola ginsengisoli TaxID=444608 RepID=UPI0003B6D2B5|nr:TIGR03767 family metallophosphoesterase [Gryllotalpicola ginsengisoli]